MKPSPPPGRGAPRATHNTEAGTRQPTFSHLYLKGTAKPTLDTAFSLLSVEIKQLNTTKADSLKGYIQTQVWVLLFFFLTFFCLFLFFNIPFLKRQASILEKGKIKNKNQDNSSTLIFIWEKGEREFWVAHPTLFPGRSLLSMAPLSFMGEGTGLGGCGRRELAEGE